VNTQQRIAQKPSSMTGLFALLSGLLRIAGSGAGGRGLNPGSANRISLGRRAAAKTFTRNNNKRVQARNGRQATTRRISTQPGCVAHFRNTRFLLPALVLASLALPASASAYATLEAPPIFSSATGLPDGRVYEQVSPADKNGNEAGAGTNPQGVGAQDHYGLAAAGGDSVLFEGTGPMGESPWGASQYFVASKNQGSAGWSTRALLPAAQQTIDELGGTLYISPTYVDPSPDLSHVIFQSNLGTYATPPDSQCKGASGSLGPNQLYLSGPDPFMPATWLERPAPATEDPIENCHEKLGAPAGGTPDFSTVYFTFAGTLLPEDAGRAPHAGSGPTVKAWGFYEDREGALREVGLLPGGGPDPDPFGAVPAASGHGKAYAGNQVSADGTRAFFVSPDPAAVGSCVTAEEGKGDSAAQAAVVCAPELYVRENGERTLLVSRDTLLPAVGGLPAAAPTGALAMPNPPSSGSYVFASPDGSQAFFQSEDRLTAAAPEGPPGNTSAKMYDFDVDTGALTYLPNVVGQIVATDEHGSSFAFVRPEAGGEPAVLDLWSGPGGGSVTPVTRLPESASVPEARMSSDGSALVFQTPALIAGFNDGGTHPNPYNGHELEPGTEQVYRYDVPANALGCVSCPPHGVTPSGDASISVLLASETYEEKAAIPAMVDERGISSNGDRVFFDSPDPLVPQDSNTNAPELEVSQGGFQKQGRDVYEWENGVVYLISGGKSARNSLLLDNSENGDDVFFATTEGLVPGDTDGAYDVYDARVPHPGDNPPAAAVPCEGAVCQGPPNVPAPLTPPASATFSGLGNPTPEVVPPPPTKTTTKTVKCAKGKKLSHGKCVKTKSKKKKTNTKRGAKS
jgi:hypothetical protein